MPQTARRLLPQAQPDIRELDDEEPRLPCPSPQVQQTQSQPQQQDGAAAAKPSRGSAWLDKI